MDRNQKTVAAVVHQATAAAAHEATRERLGKLTGEDFPALACLLDLLAEHPAVVENGTLSGSITAVQGLFVRLWDNCEALGG